MRRWAELKLPVFVVLGSLALGACDEDDETSYVQFNADDDALSIDVGAAELGEPTTIDLHSTTGEVVIGTASVDPSAGPIGTEHTLIVQISDNYENLVDRVSVRTDSGDRGEDEYDFISDSADEGLYKRILVSVGAEGEQRTDTLTIRVWDVEDDDDGDAGTDTADTGDTGS